MRTNALHSTVLGYMLMKFPPSLRTSLSSFYSTEHHDQVAICVPNVQTVMDTVGLRFFSVIPAVGGLYSAIDSYSFLHSFARLFFFLFSFFLNQTGFLLQAEEIWYWSLIRETSPFRILENMWILKWGIVLSFLCLNWGLKNDEATRGQVLTLRVLLMLRSSTFAGLSSPYAWCRRTAQSCSSPAWWTSATRGHCRSRCNRAVVRRRWLPAGHPGSSSRWWWGGWGPACRARHCPCPSRTPGWQRGAPHQGWRGWRRRTANLERHGLWNQERVITQMQTV